MLKLVSNPRSRYCQRFRIRNEFTNIRNHLIGEDTACLRRVDIFHSRAGDYIINNGIHQLIIAVDFNFCDKFELFSCVVSLRSCPHQLDTPTFYTDSQIINTYRECIGLFQKKIRGILIIWMFPVPLRRHGAQYYILPAL